MTTPAFEKLGLFYLGKTIEPGSETPNPEEFLLYDAKDLVTHAVCVGMTGSGKTGLCVDLLEEAAIDNIPAIIVDPKGDLGNLLLTFPGLRGSDFRPWITEAEAARSNISPEAYAEQQADIWRKGLAEWGQDGERIRLLKESAEFAIYTPGSTAGIPVSIVNSFAAPGEDERRDPELLRDRVQTTTSGLLGLLGIDADPLQSREHILIANILEHAWQSGTDLDLASVIRLIQTPPLQRVGVFDLESFFPSADRFKLAMTLNNLLAAPGFASWMEGDPLDIQQLLYTDRGKPRISILSIGHLSDAERMFFVTLLLNQVLGWMRAQSGTTSLRALLYMDEVFGFFPPVSEPPSKRPLLTLLKQARAFGLGVVLATQNPVDLDYKGLSNAGTWFVGRLQTERDKERLVAGLTGISGGSGAPIDGATLAGLISGLGKRVFLLHNVHESRPVLFQTRWALSYLAGPLTRAQIKQLSGDREKPSEGEGSSPAGAPPPRSKGGGGRAFPERPQLPPETRQYFAPAESRPEGGGELVYHPFYFASGRVQIIDNKYGITRDVRSCHLFELEEDFAGVLWDEAAETSAGAESWSGEPEEGAKYLAVPPPALQKRKLSSTEKSYADFLYRRSQISLWKSSLFKSVSEPLETEAAFRIRLQQAARERRDAELERLRKRYEARFRSLQDRMLRAEQRIDREQEQYGQQKVQTAISAGAALLGALFGRKIATVGNIGRATTAARGATRLSREKEDVARAGEQLEHLRGQLSDLEEQVRQETDALTQSFDPQQETLQEITIRPAKGDIRVLDFGILWVPYSHGASGITESLYSAK